MRKPAFGSKWLDHHYDYDDPPKQASGPAEQAPAPAGFRIVTVRECVSKVREKAPGKWETIRAAKRAKEAAEQAKGRLAICKFCRESFRTTSEEVGICVCPSCRSKTTTKKAQ
jgi:hypothetical protein